VGKQRSRKTRLKINIEAPKSNVQMFEIEPELVMKAAKLCVSADFTYDEEKPDQDNYEVFVLL
jgi:hypothetical protein